MERCERPPPPPPQQQQQHRRSRSKNPSFSSTLLDAIYRSIDLEQHPDGDDAHRGAPDRSSARHSLEEELQMRTPRSSSADSCCRSTKPTPMVSHRASLNPPGVPGSRHRRSVVSAASCSSSSFSSSSSSSSCSISSSAATTAATTSTTTTGAASSSSTGFSSLSDAESIHRVHRLDSPAQEKKNKQKKMSRCGSIRGGLRGFRKGRAAGAAAAPPQGTAPASPGARLASFINALFSGAGSPKKTKIVTPTTTTTSSATSAAIGVGGDDSASRSSASSCRRSCLSKAAPAAARRTSGTEAGKRSVRFYPVSVIVDEESRPCGHKRLQDEAVAARMEELLRAAAAEEEEEDDDDDEEGSESSSDLFELENLMAVMEGGRKGGYGDELPVYETTDHSTNLAIAHGLIH